jgi:hypothetical protein
MSSQSFQLENSPVERSDAKSYRSARSLPYELRHHCLVYIEEQLCRLRLWPQFICHSLTILDTSALNLLNNLLVSGTSYPTPALPAYAPPPAHIAIASTLLVHPIHTTRAASSERLEVSAYSYILLRNTLNILGPVNAHLGEAFIFKSSRSNRRGRQGNVTREGSAASGSDDEAITSAIASENGLWTKAQDFWHVVGWGFNCSVRHPKRWEYWRPWLAFMVDVLEDDWTERERLDKDDKDYVDRLTRDSNPESDRNMLKDCILLTYLCTGGSRSMAIKRVVKSLFADGSVESLRSYPEVFPNETREAHGANGTKRKRDMIVNVDREKYGDYLDGDDFEQVEPTFDSSIPSQRASPLSDDEGSTKPGSKSSSKLAMGGPEAMTLRLRLLALISRACEEFPSEFCNIPDLYEHYYDNIRPLPIPSFSLFVSPSARSHLLPTQLSSIAQLHLRRLLPGNTPAVMLDDDGLNQEVLEVCYLPFAANTSSLEDNVKVAICIETLLMLFATNCFLEPTSTLRKAINAGIKARQKRLIDRRKKVAVKSEEELANLEVMKNCGMRMTWLFEMLKRKEGS